MEIPINQSGFVSNRSETELQSQAPVPPVGRAEPEAGAASVILLSDGESRKRGLGLRGRIPIKKRARGIKDPGWISNLTTKVDFVQVSLFVIAPFGALCDQSEFCPGT